MMMLTMANLKVFSDSFSHTRSRSPRRSFGLHWSFIERHWFVEIISKPPERKKPQKLTVNEGDFSRPPTETQPLTVTVSTNTHTQANKRKKGTQNGWNLLWMPAYSVLMDLGSFDFQDRPWDRRARDVSHPQEQMCPLTPSVSMISALPDSSFNLWKLISIMELKQIKQFWLFALSSELSHNSAFIFTNCEM